MIYSFQLLTFLVRNVLFIGTFIQHSLSHTVGATAGRAGHMTAGFEDRLGSGDTFQMLDVV